MRILNEKSVCYSKDKDYWDYKEWWWNLYDRMWSFLDSTYLLHNNTFSHDLLHSYNISTYLPTQPPTTFDPSLLYSINYLYFYIFLQIINLNLNLTFYLPAKSSWGTKSKGANSLTSFTSATKQPIITADRRKQDRGEGIIRQCRRKKPTKLVRFDRDTQDVDN